MSRGMGQIERAIEAAMWEHASNVERWRRGPRIYRTAWHLATSVYEIDTDADEPTPAQMKAVYRAMHSLARKSPCFKLEGGRDEALHLTYKLAPETPKKKRKPGGGRKPMPRLEATKRKRKFKTHPPRSLSWS